MLVSRFGMAAGCWLVGLGWRQVAGWQVRDGTRLLVGRFKMAPGCWLAWVVAGWQVAGWHGHQLLVSRFGMAPGCWLAGLGWWQV